MALALRLLFPLVSVAGSACAGAVLPPRAARNPLDFRDGTVPSADAVPIHYLEGGQGETALVFVHGWLGNASWWEPVMERFAPGHRVVALDLAGHGRSGKERTDWTVDHFAEDVAAVVRALDLQRTVLLGHSMSGAITVRAANLLAGRVILLVPVDTLQDVEWDLSPAMWAEFFGGLRANFPDAVEGFFRGMLFAPESPSEVVARVVAEARAADPALAVPMLERAREFDVKAALRELRVPIHAINSDRNPTRLETNRNYARSWDVEVFHGMGHWPMLEDPEAFAQALSVVLAGLEPAVP